MGGLVFWEFLLLEQNWNYLVMIVPKSSLYVWWFCSLSLILELARRSNMPVKENALPADSFVNENKKSEPVVKRL
jgi:hypothetical protein